MSRCRACGADVFFARTVNGKTMPLDPNPTDAGNVALDRPDYSQPPIAVVMTGVLLDAARERADVPLYLSHFATCPHADRFRTKPAPKPPPLPDNVVPFRSRA